MKTRPIIFNGEMVRAILGNKKTQTRRVMKPQPVESFAEDFNPDGTIKERRSYGWTWKGIEDKVAWRSPHGVPGDRLWVRETWCPMQDIAACVAEGEPIDIVYKADWDADGVSLEEARDAGVDRWRASIFIPRWASRITLEVTGVRVVRVQDITEDDVIAEGCGLASWGPDPYTGGPLGPETAGFAQLWDSINVKRAYGWDTNPWVWVIEFQLIEKILEDY